MEIVDDKVAKLILDVSTGSIRAPDAAASLRVLDKSVNVSATILDYSWLGGFSDSAESKSRLQQLMSLLMQDEFISISDAVCLLDGDLIPLEVLTDQVLRRKRTQAKTKRVYNITKYNVLSECPEGFAIFSDVLWSIGDFGGDASELENRCKTLIGQFSLCPNRCMSLALTVLMATDSEIVSSLISRLFPQTRVESVVLFHLTHINGQSHILKKFISSILNLSIDLGVLWQNLTPSNDEISVTVANLLDVYESKIDSLGKILGGSLTPEEEGVDPVDVQLSNAIANCGLLESQKVIFIVQLCTKNALEKCIPFLNDLQKQFGQIPIGAIPPIGSVLADLINARLHIDNEQILLYLLDLIGVYLGNFPIVFANLCKFLKPNTQYEFVHRIVGKTCLPVLSVISPNPFLVSLVWDLIDTGVNHGLYEEWNLQYDVKFPLRLVRSMIHCEVRSLLKRVVKGAQIGDLASRNSHHQFAKLATNNPLVVLGYILSQISVHFNYNLIEPYVDVTAKIGFLAQDVCMYLVCVNVASTSRPALNMKTASVEPWLNHLSEFTGKFLKKHPNTNLRGFFWVLGQILESANSPLKSIAARTMLEAIVEHMGSCQVVHSLNADQLEAVAGGPTLKLVSQQSSVVSSERSSIVERAKLGLQKNLDPHFVEKVFKCLSNELGQLQSSQKLAQELMVGGGVKLLGILNDGIHSCVLQLREFTTGRVDGVKMHAPVPNGVCSVLWNTFWSLSLYDIHVPSYQGQISSLIEQIGAQEMLCEKFEKKTEEHKLAKKELVRLKDLLTRLEREFQDQQANFMSIQKRLRAEKSEWNFSGFVFEYVSKRVLMSIQDALFCVHFIKMLVKEKVVGFSLANFFDQWTKWLPKIIACSSEGETRLFADFVAEIMIHTTSNATRDERIRWESNILEHLLAALNFSDWCDKRNALILISKTCHVLPKFDSNAKLLQSAIENTIANDPQEDIKMLAVSLGRKLGSFESTWLEKPADVDAKKSASEEPKKTASEEPKKTASKRFADEYRRDDTSKRSRDDRRDDRRDNKRR